MFPTKVVEKIITHILCSVNVFLKSRRLRDNVKNLCTAGQATNIHFWSYLSEFYLEREIFQTKVVEKIKTHILCPVNVFLKSRSLRDNVKNLCTAGQATNIHFWSYLSEFYLEREIFQAEVVEKIKTHVLCSVNVFLKSRRLRDNVEKTWYSRTGHRYTFLIISRWILLRTRNVSDKSCRENQNTHFVFSALFSPSNRTVYEI